MGPLGKNTLLSEWEKAARRRRALVSVLILGSTLVAATYMANILPHRGRTGLEIAMVGVFGALFAWISIGFWEAVFGLFTLVRRCDRFAAALPGREGFALKKDVRTALLLPIANEDAARVFAGLRATYESIARTGELEHFDFFVLSDTGDPDLWVEEEIAWANLCKAVGGTKRIFYRRRRVNLKRKSGNIADFCRRWGQQYRYMVVLDADSVLSGSCVLRMVTAMERNPKIGILQTSPQAVNRESLLARAQQFATHVYGPVFTAGLHYLQLGDSHFWGHNAILRLEPFMEHCSLPALPGNPPFGGSILSHDFVEAALMRRAGWEVWLAHDVEGSYEEVPPSLLDELKRDRRWCQGNLQHIRLVFTKGLCPAHRALFLHGIMAYGSSLLWLLFLSLSTAEAIFLAFQKPDYFPAERSLFPAWPVWPVRWALTLLVTTAIILFLPKLLSVLVIVVKHRRAREFGGVIRLFLSMVLEVVLSMLFAPIRMLFHSKFVTMTLLGMKVGWGPQQRSDLGTTWSEALRYHGPSAVFALLWATALFLYNRSFFWWNAPVFVPLLLSVPLSVLSSRGSVGELFRKLGLFLIPEEVAPPMELEALVRFQNEEKDARSLLPKPWHGGFVRAIADPLSNALHISLLRKERRVSPAVAARREALEKKALNQGPESLGKGEKKELLYDPGRLNALHHRVWEIREKELAEKWGIPS